MTQVVLVVDSDDELFVRWLMRVTFEDLGIARVTSVSRGSYRFREGVKICGNES